MSFDKIFYNDVEFYKYEFSDIVPVPGFILKQEKLQRNKINVFSFDLGVNYMVSYTDDHQRLVKIGLKIGDGYSKVVVLDPSSIHSVDEGSLYAIHDKGIVKLELFTEDGYLKLHMPPGAGSSTLNINGIHMHQITNKSPFNDSEAKVAYAGVRRGDRVLDICTGLGYTAIASVLRGARLVITVEVNRYVLGLAELNPWSFYLKVKNIVILNSDAVKALPLMKDNTFDKVIHDPPRFSIAGELYSRDFYREIYRVLRPGGILFHYTGKPMHHRGRGLGPIVRGVKKRLEEAGFIVKRYIDDAAGLVAIKPR